MLVTFPGFVNIFIFSLTISPTGLVNCRERIITNKNIQMYEKKTR